MDEDYVYDPFDDGSSKLVRERMLHDMEDFVETYSDKLKEIEETLHEALSDTWDSNVDPLGLHVEPYEQTKVVELIKTDNKLLNKVLIVFASLGLEIDKLSSEASKTFYPPFLLFGEEETSDEINEGDAQVQIGRMLDPFLLELSQFVNRCYLVAQNVIRQLASLYYRRQKLYATSFKSIHLRSVYASLGDLLVCLITLDEIIAHNELFHLAWRKFKRMTKGVKANPSKYNVEDEQLGQFEKLLLSLEGQLLDGLIFQNCVEQEFDFPGLVEVRSNAIFKEEFFKNIKALFLHVSVRLGTSTEEDVRRKYLGVCALYSMYMGIFRDGSDKTFFRQLWNLQNKAPIVHLAGNVFWLGPEFFIRQMKEMVAGLGKIAITKFRQDHLQALDRNLPTAVHKLYTEASVWMIRMESNLTNRAEMREILNTRQALFNQGPILAYRIGHLFKELVYLHVTLKVPVKRKQIPLLFTLVELLKAIQSTFHRSSTMIGQSISYMIQQSAFYLSKTLYPLKVRLESSRKYSDAKLDVLAGITLALQMLNGPATPARLRALALSLHVVFQPEFMKEKELDTLRLYHRRLESVCGLARKIKQSCDAAFFYWNRELVPLYYADIYSSPEQAHKLHYLFAAFRDVIPMLQKTVHVPPATFIDAYKQDIYAAFQHEILDKLCRDIETDLRLHIHAHLEVDKNRDPFRNGVVDRSSIVQLRSIRFFDRTIDVKAYVSHYLDTTFYNLTTVALYDWKTYGEMRNLAEEKYALDLTEVHLPGQTLEQGLDVLEIMRNIHIFVSKYRYNLNNQIFVQSSADNKNKTLNTINITHIANSIRTHGTGIMNTTVNYTYQFLRQKFFIFSQFLYDDHIKSRLFKDTRFYRDSKEELDNRYPFERAERFNKDIRKLGMTEDGLSYLDKFRILITEIGNAMGYIRMIRSGGLYYTSNAIKFVPDLQQITKFEDLVTDTSLSTSTTEAAHNLDSAIGNLATNFAEGTAYFKMLVNVFAGELRDDRNSHLKNFYVIVPPLTINFVERVLLSKDKLSKMKTRGEGHFTDDGFPIGIAYILKLLEQYHAFDSLHWWDSVIGHYDAELAKLSKLAQSAKKKRRKADAEDQRTMALTIKKLQAYKREFELLKFSFTGSRVFFFD